MRAGARIPVLILLALLTACLPLETDTAHPVTLIADGQTRTFTTDALTVRDLLAEADITLDADDRVTPVEPTLITDGMIVRVVRVEVHTETEQREIPFERHTVRDASVAAGETRLLETGHSGLEELAYRVTLEDGEEVERQLVRRVMLREPRAELILIGVQAERGATPITGTVAYLANRNAYVMQTTTANQRRLTHSGDLDRRVFALSPDGAYLLFTRIPTTTTQPTALNTLWGIETTVADARPAPLQVENLLWADWEPGCKAGLANARCRIVYTTGSTAEGNPGWKAANDLWIVGFRRRAGAGEAPALSGAQRLIAPGAGGVYGWWGAAYAWSPIGGMLAYARADEVGIIRIPADGAPARATALVSFPPYRTYAPWVWTPTVSWSPEGKFISAALHGAPPTSESPEESPVFDVWVLAADGSLKARLVRETGMWAVPRYAPAGDLISFGRARSPYVSQTSGYDLYVMDRDGSDQRRIFPAEGEIGLDYPDVAWGPGGDRLLVIYRGNLYLVTLAGEVYQLTDEGNVTAVQWRW